MKPLKNYMKLRLIFKRGRYIVLSRQSLEELKVLNKKEVNTNELQELNDIKIDTNLPIEERLESFLNQIKNPYYFKVSGTAVQISFADNQKTLDEALRNYLTDIKNLEDWESYDKI